jgi:hypothetical protein
MRAGMIAMALVLMGVATFAVALEERTDADALEESTEVEPQAVKEDPQTTEGDQAVPPLSKEHMTPEYELVEPSMYAQGCFGVGWRPCKCPVHLASSFVGTFGLQRLPGSEPDFETYELFGVEWFATVDDDVIALTGSGFYQVCEEEGEMIQRLEMDLQVDDGVTYYFDSGWVPGGTGGIFPEISISIRLPDSDCLNMVMDIEAQRV